MDHGRSGHHALLHAELVRHQENELVHVEMMIKSRPKNAEPHNVVNCWSGHNGLHAAEAVTTENHQEPVQLPAPTVNQSTAKSESVQTETVNTLNGVNGHHAQLPVVLMDSKLANEHTHAPHNQMYNDEHADEAYVHTSVFGHSGLAVAHHASKVPRAESEPVSTEKSVTSDASAKLFKPQIVHSAKECGVIGVIGPHAANLATVEFKPENENTHAVSHHKLKAKHATLALEPLVHGLSGVCAPPHAAVALAADSESTLALMKKTHKLNHVEWMSFHTACGACGVCAQPHVPGESEQENEPTFADLNHKSNKRLATHSREHTPCGQCGHFVVPHAAVECDNESVSTAVVWMMKSLLKIATLVFAHTGLDGLHGASAAHRVLKESKPEHELVRQQPHTYQLSVRELDSNHVRAMLDQVNGDHGLNSPHALLPATAER